MNHNSGNYAIKVPAGTYLLWAFESNFVADLAAAPTLVLSNTATIVTNLTLLPATRSISGKFTDANNASLGLPGILVACQSSAGLLATGVSDTNGNYTVRVTASQWQMMWDRANFNTLGYLLPEEAPTADTSSGNAVANVAFPRGTALIYGTITDDQAHPLPGVTFGDVTYGAYQADATSDQNGNYFMAVTAGEWYGAIDAEYSGYGNYDFFPGDLGGVVITNGQAWQVDFVGTLATNFFPVINTDDSGAGSLRQAILDANGNPGQDRITFVIPGAGVHTITPSSPLPTVTGPVIIDGTTQPGFAGKPIIELNGSNAGSSAYGLDITAGYSTVHGLVINRFSLDGIHLSANGGNDIRGNFIGTDVWGTNALGNSGSAVVVDNCADNLIGGTEPGDGNVLSGNGCGSVGNHDGLNLNSGASNNVAQGNFIGTDVTGTKKLGNARAGVVIWHAVNNTIGGTATGSRNVISGNANDGIIIVESDTRGNLVQGNFIGTDITGAAGLGNSGAGVMLGGGASANTIGGTSASARNIISGNAWDGVFIGGAASNTVAGNFIGTDWTGATALANAVNGVEINSSAANTIGGTSASARNVISGNSAYGLSLQTGASNNVVQGNFIGTDATGTHALGNGADGVAIGNISPNNTIGGTAPAARNVISGNGGDGIIIGQIGTTGNTILGNFIGTDVTGTNALGNAGQGVHIGDGASNNTIGGVAAGAGNVISGNAKRGVAVWDLGTTGNVVAGNLIGTDATGTKALGNDFHGVSIAFGVTGTTVGGLVPATRNVLSGNGMVGAIIGGSSNNVIAGNFIGTDIGGTNALGNQGGGVVLQLGAIANLVGGNTAGARNVISGNEAEGVSIVETGGNFVRGNFIGLDVMGNALGNLGSGVYVYLGTNTLVGGTNPGEANVIAFNLAGPYSAGEGVIVESGIGNAILGNAIYANAALGIALGTNGVVLNDLGDADTGPNDLQNFPVLTSAVSTSSNTVVQGTLNSTPNTGFTLEFFSNAACDSSGFGEGKTFIGATNVTTDLSGNITFTATFTPSVALGRMITATATDPAGNTSEFSPCAQVTNAPPVNQPPFITAVGMPQPGQFRLTFDTTFGVNYTIQASTNLETWISLLIFRSPGGLMTIIDPNVTGSSLRFYRVKIGQ